MTVRLRIQNNLQVIIPIRFARAVTGAPVLDAPDLDDRGYEMARPGGLNPTSCRGPMFGMMVGDTVRVQIVREDLDDSGRLFATAERTSTPQFEIVSPAAGSPIAADGIVSVRATDDNLVGQKLEIHFGSATGPIIAEAEPHIFNPRTFAVTPHIVTIHQAAAAPGTGTAPTIGGAALDVTRIFDLVQAIWRPVGIDLNIAATQNDEVFGFPFDNFSPIRAGIGPGTMGHIVNNNFVAGTCNVYFIRFLENVLGVGISRENRPIFAWTNPGVIVPIDGTMNAAGAVVFPRAGSVADLFQLIGNDTAHEIGHFLTLPHADLVDAPGRTDTYCRRQLMHPQHPLAAANPIPPQNAANNSDVRFTDVGYGVAGGFGHNGSMITLKDYATHASDSETVTVRRRFNSPNLF